MSRSKPTTSVLAIDFKNPEAMENFWVWLCESGEQHYWEWMKYREEEEEGDITALSFDYTKANKGAVFTEVGRFTEYKDFPDE